MNFIKCKEDIVTLRHGREWAGFDGFVEGMLRKFDCKFVKVKNLAFHRLPVLLVTMR
jgi:hypothetical protein